MTYQRVLGKQIPASNTYLWKELLWKCFCQVSWNCTTFIPMSGPRKVDCASETPWFSFLRVIIGLWELYCIITAYYIEFLEMGSYFVSEACLISPAALRICHRKLFICLSFIFSLQLSLLFHHSSFFFSFTCFISLIFLNYGALDMKVFWNCQQWK